jgi:hypothetical protein
MAIEGTKKRNVPFDKADLARVVLNSVLVTWVNQCNMTHSTHPKSPRILLPNPEAIKHVMNEKHQANLKIKAMETSTASASAKGSPKKCSALGGTGEQVPKKQGLQSSASVARTRAAPI